VNSLLEIRGLVAQANQLAELGRMDEAEAAFRAVLDAAPNNIEAHVFLGDRAYRQGEDAQAIASYEACQKLAPRAAIFPFKLGLCKERAGDLAGAAQSYVEAFRTNPRDWRTALFAGYALDAVGRHEDAAVVFSLGDDVNLAVRTAKDDPSADPEIRMRAKVADRVFCEFFTALHARAVDEAESLAPGADLSRVRRAIWPKTHDQPVHYRTPLQEPSIFYCPDLEPAPTMPRDRLPWAETVEAATDDIRSEYLAAIQSGASMEPYIHAQWPDPAWEKLRGQLDWSSLHLYAAAHETPFAQAFPKTLAVLRSTGVLPLVQGTPVELFFSRLKPGAHIPPHFGCINSRLTVHLPLIVPSGCSIRVGSEIHSWTEGQIFAFDDSFEHEAWNRGDSDRVVLIFEAHRPDLSAEERDAIEFVFSKREGWRRSRQIP
jgi:aspartate beta-hydroxylase